MKKAQQPEKKGSITEEIEKLKQRREERKNKNFEDKKNQDKKDDNNGKACDAYYENLMKKKKIAFNIEPEQHVSSETAKIFVIVRKRPISKKEVLNGEIDCVSTINPKIYVHECKIKVDGITKYIEDHEFYFDNSFSDRETTEDVYNYTINPNINLILNKGVVTCFAYGQTGSGKTYTMKGIQNLAIDSLYNQAQMINKKFDFYISFFEIYGGRLFDLLNNKNKLNVLEDKNQKVQIFGLEEKIARIPDEMREIIDLGNSIRTTHNTVTNETSSRSHAICNIVVKERDSDEEYSKLTLVDLAGSERAQETQSNDRNRRAEGAEINKSLLALKECIRALDARKNGSDTHVPFRASKLTLVLRDSFLSKSDKSKIIMIACVGPGITSANHSINTLRYSDRLKEKTSQMSAQSKDLSNPMNININNINIPSQKNSQNVNNVNYLNSQPNAINNNNNNNNNNIQVHLSNNNLGSNANNINIINNNNYQNQKVSNYNVQANNARNLNNFNNVNNNSNINNNQGGNVNNNHNNIISKINIPYINLNYNNQNNQQQNQINNNNNNLYHNLPAYVKKNRVNDEMINNNNNNNNNNFNNNFNNGLNNYNNNNNINNIILPKDENLADLIMDDNFLNNQTDDFLSAQKIQEGDDWEYLKKTISKEGKHLSDDFIRYHQITDQIVEDEDIIINNHMNIIKEDAKLLTEEGDLITNIKGIGEELDFKMDEYAMRLEKIINKKIAIYTDLKKKIDIYKQHIKEEDEIRSKLNPKFFIDN